MSSLLRSILMAGVAVGVDVSGRFIVDEGAVDGAKVAVEVKPVGNAVTAEVVNVYSG
jgi:hypothetical protein